MNSHTSKFTSTSRYLKRDPRQVEILHDKEKTASTQLQARLDNNAREATLTVSSPSLMR
jgi:hypothetical protein